MKKIILFADPGIDDSIAIMYALMHPQIEVLAIVSSYGNVTKQKAVDNAAFLLNKAGFSSIPMIGGTNSPLSGETPEYYPEIHGPDGLGPLTPPPFKGRLNNFSDLYDILHAHTDVTIVDIGRNTALAHLFLLGSDIEPHIKDIFLMGGAFLVPGNVTPSAEANFFGDPVAANIILQRATTIYIIPLNVTSKAVITPHHIQQITAYSSHPLVPIIKELMDYYTEAYQTLIPGIKGAPLHDVLTLYLMVNPGKGRYVRRSVSVLVEGEGKGTSIADFRPGSRSKPGDPAICLEFDVQAFIDDFIFTISSSPISTRAHLKREDRS
ncbi:nucleoside hydrolase [Halobacillus kuroshimensis]|uniref:nucleoside hydrolase n=1 Tax=Halobacillus kuroshimensis TaxID=302481 RepID=UPI00041B595C|nr:nucleoside hydrolase [Halobacillus kuroshimensis]